MQLFSPVWMDLKQACLCGSSLNGSGKPNRLPGTSRAHSSLSTAVGVTDLPAAVVILALITTHVPYVLQHMGVTPPEDGDYAEMTCGGCVERLHFLGRYAADPGQSQYDMKCWRGIRLSLLARASLGYRIQPNPRRWGCKYYNPLLTPQPMVGEWPARRRSKALNEKILVDDWNFLKKVTWRTINSSVLKLSSNASQ